MSAYSTKYEMTLATEFIEEKNNIQFNNRGIKNRNKILYNKFI